MNEQRYKRLKECLEEGFSLDEATLLVVNPRGRKLALSNHGKGRVPILTIKGRQYSITEVIGTWYGMDVVGNFCFFRDGNRKNYRPENLIWTDKKTGNKYHMSLKPPAAKLTRGMAEFIRTFKLGEGIGVKELADLYGVSHYTIKDIRSRSKSSWAKLPIVANQHIEVHT